MATSESDDFESADEEMGQDTPGKRGAQTRQWSSPTAIDSESDDDTEYVPRTPRTNVFYSGKADRFSSSRTAATTGEGTPGTDTVDKKTDEASIKGIPKTEMTEPKVDGHEQALDCTNQNSENATDQEQEKKAKEDDLTKTSSGSNIAGSNTKADKEVESVARKSGSSGRGRVGAQRRSDGSRQSGVKKLGTRIVQNNVKHNVDTTSKDNIKVEEEEESVSTRLENLSINELSLMDELTELDMPEEMKSDKKFKDVFTPDGWEGLGNEIELPTDLTEEKLQPILERLSSVGQETEDSPGVWGSWGNWGVGSLINTATAGVTTLTSHVSHGLTLLEETIGSPEPTEFSRTMEHEGPEVGDNKADAPEESQSQSSFGFGNFMSSVSSITKLVESTGSKVMSGGLDTLEAIGKKTMEVLQEGDPGLKKKRAFFANEANKPILSQILREAKDKADTAEKTLEEKEIARKVHFESLFDDYQGLVHLEALEMLSKQSNIKIQQRLVELDTRELNSMQETLEEVKELCELCEDDENDDDHDEKDLKLRLTDACSDLGVNITYEKLCVVWEESQSYLATPLTHSDQEIFQYAVSSLAQFTAFSVERFHKTAELLLIKEHRSTVNEADALVQLTHILCHQIGVLANSFCSSLNELVKSVEKPESINGNITIIFLEASNASSYIQDAFRLLIPIVQVGAI